MTDSNNLFFGVTLDDAKSSVTWDFTADDDRRCHKLELKQIMLDVEAKYDEHNVIEVNHVGNQSLIAVLKAGENRTANPQVPFYESLVTFSLIEGSGPVHLIGQILRDDLEIVCISENGHCTFNFNNFIL